MTGLAIGEDAADVERRSVEILQWTGLPTDDPAESLRQQHFLVGTVPEVLDQLRTLERAGVERIFLQHLVHRDLEVLELIGREIIPAMA
jgi:alkanesulfonate monooxygenase SsuD/methylene tetrahydromethanopterin reductase-like flavin-dependent oxidoreductase (luciferase family)